MQSRSFKKLLESIEELKHSEVRNLVDERIREFKETGKKPSAEIFKELCFCILTASYRADRSIKIQEEIDEGFLYLPEGQLAERLKVLGHRFPNPRARYIVEARRYSGTLGTLLSSFESEMDLREWLIKNVKGIGPKEASHFLRNIGRNNFAILDFHIINVLVRYGVIEKLETLTKRRYFEIEDLLRKIARTTNVTLAELDLYLWYTETGKVLK